MGISRNFLPRAAMRALEDLVMMQADSIKAGNWTQITFAEMATKRLQEANYRNNKGELVVVTDSNVQSACETVNIQFSRTHRRVVINTELTRRLLVLTEAMIEVYQADGLLLPSTLSAMQAVLEEELRRGEALERGANGQEGAKEA